MDNTTKVKICGIKTFEIARAAADYGADFIGLVFADSKRQVDIKSAQIIRKNVLDKRIVGVFKNQTLSEINEVIKLVNIDIVQLHGDENPAILSKITLPVWRSVAVNLDGKTSFDLSSWQGVEAFLFDTALPDGSSGGAGKSFAWQEELSKNIKQKIVLAGGLNVDNVQKAISILKPYAVDVSGGVEINGEKSPELIKIFIQKVKGDTRDA